MNCISGVSVYLAIERNVEVLAFIYFSHTHISIYIHYIWIDVE